MSAESTNAAPATPVNASLAAAQAATSAIVTPSPVTSQKSPVTSSTQPRLLVLAIIGLLIGAAGGALRVAAIHTSLTQSLIYGAIFGVAFGALFSRRCTSAGAGLIWGLGFAFLAWIVFPNGAIRLLFQHTSGAMFFDARDRFPHLVAYILCLGAPVGLAFGIWGGLHPTTQQPKFHIGRAIVACPTKAGPILYWAGAELQPNCVIQRTKARMRFSVRPDTVSVGAEIALQLWVRTEERLGG